MDAKGTVNRLVLERYTFMDTRAAGLHRYLVSASGKALSG
jgi:hypothetical protein